MKSKKIITKKTTKSVKQSIAKASLRRQVKASLESDSSSSDSESDIESKDNSEEKEEVIEKKEEDFKDIVKVLSFVFPLNISKEDLLIDEDPVKDIKSSNGREITFTAKYKQIDVLCVRIIVYGDVAFHQQQYFYAYELSERLIACRNMANYHAIFQCDNINFLKSSVKKPDLLLMKPLYSNGTLQQYFMQLRKSGNDHVPHIYMLQMAVTLFSMLSDAHAQNIGLVNINADNLYISDDHGLYFDGFEACIPFDETDLIHNKFWMNLNMLKCPESYKAKNYNYLPSTDVYLATIILIELAKDYKFTQKPYILDKGNQQVTLKKEAIHKDHQIVIDIIEKGLKFNPNDRPKASDMLKELEQTRARHLGLALL